MKWLQDSIALVHFDAAFAMQNSGDYNNTSLLQLIDTIKSAHGIIIDLRKKPLLTMYTPCITKICL
ncbi:MAG: hypothetical protein WKG06_36115 [Segetibacter sp.]